MFQELENTLLILLNVVINKFSFMKVKCVFEANYYFVTNKVIQLRQTTFGFIKATDIPTLSEVDWLLSIIASL